MRRTFLLLACFLLFSSNFASAKKRTLEEMRTAVSLALKTHPGLRKASAIHQESGLNIVKEESQLTVLSNERSFAVISNDDTFDAILAYVDSPFTDLYLTNPGLAWWLEAMNESLEQYLLTGTRPNRIKVNPNYQPSVESFVSTRWAQSEPYYNMTPTYKEGGNELHFVTGCVATSMAQIMKYYNYPATGKGSKSYRCKMYATSGDPITKLISVSFSSGNYDWANMLDVYGKTYEKVNADAVAKLMYHCGVSVTMDYDKSGSGSFGFKAADALCNNFLYNENLQFYVRDIFHQDEWMDIIFKHLSAGHPILYDGQSKSGGHCFILDGYSSAGLVHVNWGWGGSSDGYFDIASLNGYSSGQDMVPVFLPDYLTEYHSTLGLYSGDAYFCVSLGSLSASADYVLNGGYKEFKGSVALMVSPLDGGEPVVLRELPQEVKGYGYDMKLHFADLNFKNVSVSDLSDGSYRVYFASKANGESGWQPVRSKEGVCNSAILTMANGKPSIAKEKDSNWTVGVSGIPYSSRPVSDEIFSVAGYRVGSGMTPYGIYVKNGKKILNK